MSVFTQTVHNTMLDAVTVDTLSIHTADPGANGTNNEVSGGGYARKAGTFAAASGGERALSSAVDFDGPADETAAWFAAWNGATFVGKGQITEGDTSFNASGEFQLTTNTKLIVRDPT